MGIAVAWLHPVSPPWPHRLAGALRMLGLAVLLANLPDLDFILEILLHRRVHHTFSHSIVFAVVFSALLAGVWALIRRERFGLSFSLTGLIYGSHILLDMLGGGPGVQLLWPFTFGYVRFPWEVFPPVHYSRSLLDPSHWTFVLFELVFTAAILGATLWLKSRQAQRAAGEVR
jgi:inner membrane protein